MKNSNQDSLGNLFEGLLKSPLSLIERIQDKENSGSIIGKLLLISFAGFLIFGITLGSFSFHEQLWAAPLKTILGIGLSSLICLPSLYIFSALTGTSLGIRDIIHGMAGTLALISGLLLGFTPVLWVFSQSTSSETFFGFLVLATWLIAVIFGTGFLFKMLSHSGTKNTAPLRVWIGIFLLVSLQMSTTLRPLIGRSDHFFTTEKRFFLEHWGLNFTSRINRTEYREPATTSDPKEPEKTKTKEPGTSKSNPFLKD